MTPRIPIAGLLVLACVMGRPAPAAAKERRLQKEALTLQECMQIALTHNRDVKRARAELERVGGDRIIEKSRFLPHADLLGSYDRSQSSSATSVVRDKSVSLRLTQRIFEFGRDPLTLVALRQDQRDAFFGLENVAASTLRLVREGFFQILLKGQQIDTREENRANFQRILEREQTKLDMREAKRADVLTAELSVRQEELRINRLERELLRRRMDLMQVLGRPVGAEVTFAGELEAFEFTEEESVALALRNSISIAVSAEDVAEQRRVVREVSTGYYPDLNVSAGVENKRDTFAFDFGRTGPRDTWALDVSAEHFFVRPNSRFQRFQDPNGFDDVGDDFVWFLSADLVVPIFRGFERKGDLMVEKAQLRQDLIALDDQKSLVELDARQAYQRFLEQKEAVRLQEETLRIARERLRIVARLREFGRATENDLEQFRTRLFVQQDALFVQQDLLVRVQEALREQMRHFEE